MATKMTITGYTSYATKEGDAFDSIALEYYNNEMLASLIMEANPDRCDVLIFDAGVKLSIPIVDSVEAPDTLPPWRRGE